MFDTRIGAMAVAFLAAAAIVPAGAQQSPQPERSAPSGTATKPSVPDETVVRTGAALKQVMEIKKVYEPKLEAAPTAEERTRLTGQASDAAKKAISDQGLTVDQYNNVMELAQADPALRDRLLKVAKLSH